MSFDIAKGTWKQIKGEIMKSWGRITDNELDQTRGDMNKIAGLVQEKYGETQEKVKERLNSFLRNIKDDVSDRNEQPRQDQL